MRCRLAFAVAKDAGRLIRQNFGLAIVYNVIALPIAIAGLCHAADRGARHVAVFRHRRRQCAAAEGRQACEDARYACYCTHGAFAAAGNGQMSSLVFLIPLALVLGIIALAAFLWSLKAGQYEDMDGAAERILLDDDTENRD